MKIKALRGCRASGEALEAGEVYDVSDSDAETLITMGKAEPADGKKGKKEKGLSTKNAGGVVSGN